MTASLPVCRPHGTLQGMAKKLKRPRDPVQLAKLIGDIATGQIEEGAPLDATASAATHFNRDIGAKGGAARAANLSPKQRQKIARAAALARWSKDKK